MDIRIGCFCFGTAGLIASARLSDQSAGERDTPDTDTRLPYGADRAGLDDGGHRPRAAVVRLPGPAVEALLNQVLVGGGAHILLALQAVKWSEMEATAPARR